MTWAARVSAVRARLKLYPVPTSTRVDGEAALAAAEQLAADAEARLKLAERIVGPERL